MKKNLIILALLVVLVSTIFAAGAQDAMVIEGKLEVNESIPFIKSNDKTYVFPAGAFYQLAFTHSIKEGDTIKAEGMAKPAEFTKYGMRNNFARILPTNDSFIFIPSKVWVNGKQLDLSTIDFGQRQFEKHDGMRYNGTYMMRNSQRANMKSPEKPFRRIR